jgi:hypothetical protein
MTHDSEIFKAQDKKHSVNFKSINCNQCILKLRSI